MALDQLPNFRRSGLCGAAETDQQKDHARSPDDHQLNPPKHEETR
jgi:hypothetical protein